MALGLASAAIAGETNGSSFYSGNELSLSLGSGYTVDHSAAFKQPYAVNLDGGVQYFFTKNIGVDATVPFYSSKGTSVSDAKAGIVFRVPVWRFAPYIGLGADYNWANDKFTDAKRADFSYVGKAGLEFRFNPYVGVFGEDVYQNNTVDVLKGSGQNTVHGGLRFRLH